MERYKDEDITGISIGWLLLLPAIAVAYGFNPEGGSKNYNFSTYDSHSELHNAIRLTKGFQKPEAALSLQRQLTLLIKINRLAKQGAQFIIASHSPILLGIPGAQILSFDAGVSHECDYLDTESYQVTEMFINNREYLLKRLLEE